MSLRTPPFLGIEVREVPFAETLNTQKETLPVRIAIRAFLCYDKLTNQY